MRPDTQHGQLSEGVKAPPFEFSGPGGEAVRSSDLLARGPVILTFYRGAWCMCCQSDLRDLRQTVPAFRKTGATVIGVFHKMAPNARADIAREYAIDFPLVDDVDGKVAEAFGIRRSPADLARIESEFGPEMLALRESEPWILPMQARFVIRKNGIVGRSEIVSNYSERTSAAGLIPVLERAG
jgi:peroxiredoxin